MTISIAILGCGRVAQHYRGFFESGAIRGASVVGACDIDPKKVNEMSLALGATPFFDFREMVLAQKPDLVVIATPSGSHYDHARQALELGCHVLVEKPAAMTPSQISANDCLATERHLMYGVGFQNRLNPSIRLLHDAVRNNRFGKIVSVAVRLRWCREQSYYEDGWHGTWASDGGVINQQAIHHVDILQWLFGPVDSVSASIANRLNHLEAEDTLVAICRLKSGALCTIEATTAARPRDFEASLTVTGELGTAKVGGIALNVVEEWDFVMPIDSDREAAFRYSQQVLTGYGLSHGLLLQQMVDALASNSVEAPVPARSSIPTAQLVHALYRSTEINGWVCLSDNPVSEKLGVGDV